MLYGCFPDIPLWAIAFNGEEEDLLGSRIFAKRVSKEFKNSLVEAHILEMVGFTAAKQTTPSGLPSVFPETGDFIGLLSNDGPTKGCRSVLQNCATYFPDRQAVGLIVPPQVVTQIPVLGRSDHRSFWEESMNAIMWTDTAEFRNPHYHQESDTPDTLDYEFLTFVTQLLVASIASRFAKLK